MAGFLPQCSRAARPVMSCACFRKLRITSHRHHWCQTSAIAGSSATTAPKTMAHAGGSKSPRRVQARMPHSEDITSRVHEFLLVAVLSRSVALPITSCITNTSDNIDRAHNTLGQDTRRANQYGEDEYFSTPSLWNVQYMASPTFHFLGCLESGQSLLHFRISSRRVCNLQSTLYDGRTVSAEYQDHTSFRLCEPFTIFSIRGVQPCCLSSSNCLFYTIVKEPASSPLKIYIGLSYSAAMLYDGRSVVGVHLLTVV